MRRTQTRSGAKARRPKRGQSHLFSCAEGAKEVSEPAEPGKPEQVNVARRKDGVGQTEHGAGQRHAGREVKIKPRRAVFYSPAEGGALRPPTRGRPSAQGKIEAKK